MSLFTAYRDQSKELERERRVGGDMLGNHGTEPKLACNWHIAVLIILLGAVSNLQSHAQASQMSSSCLPNYSFNDVPGSIPAADTAIMWPVVWQPGHTYSVTITGPTLTPTPGKCGAVGVYAREWPGYANPLGYGGADPYITLTNFTILDPTHMTYTASVSADAPIGNIFLQLSNPYAPNISFWAVMIDNPTPPSLPGAPDSSCPIPGDAVVKPDTWQAGQSYPIVITGSGFTTAAVAASNGCSETSIDVQVDAGTVTLSNVQVVSSTIIKAQAKVSDDTPEEEATIDIYGPTLGPQAIPRAPLVQGRGANAQVASTGAPGGLTLDGTAKANIQNKGKLYIVNPYLSPLNGSPRINETDLIALIASSFDYAAVRARGMITDGSATAIAIYKIGSNKQVRFTATDKLEFETWGSGFLSYAPSFGSCNSDCSILVNPIHGNDGYYYAFALVLAPPQSTDPRSHDGIAYGANVASITATVDTDKGKVSSAPTFIDIEPTPVILVHGLWGDATSLKEVANGLFNSEPWTMGTLYPVISVVCYSKTLPFDAIGGAPADCAQSSEVALETKIRAVQQSLYYAHYVGGRIDFVAHSMGGLAMRHYFDTPDYISAQNKARSRTLGAVRTVITLDTPELGSELARALLNSSIANGTCDQRVSTKDGGEMCDFTASEAGAVWGAVCHTSTTLTLAKCFGENLKNPLGPATQTGAGINLNECSAAKEPVGSTTCGAVASLIPGSPNIRQLARINKNVQWFAIASDWTDHGFDQDTSVMRHMLNDLLKDLRPARDVRSTLCDGVGTPLTLLCMIGNDSHNDVIVPLTSQAYLAGGKIATYQNLAHSSMPWYINRVPGFWGYSNASVTDGSTNPCIEIILQTSRSQAPCPGSVSSSVTRGDTTLQSEGHYSAGIGIVPGESRSAATIRSRFPATAAPERMSVSTPQDNVRLGKAVQVELSLAVEPVNTILYSQTSEGTELESGVAKVVQDSGVTKTIEIVPLQTGKLDVWISTLFGDNVIAEQTIELNVVPSNEGLMRFVLDGGVTALELKLDGDEWEREHVLTPTAEYRRAKFPVHVKDFSEIELLVEQDETKPVISIDKNGTITALHAGSATVIGKYFDEVDKIEITVLDN